MPARAPSSPVVTAQPVVAADAGSSTSFPPPFLAHPQSHDDGASVGSRFEALIQHLQAGSFVQADADSLGISSMQTHKLAASRLQPQLDTPPVANPAVPTSPPGRGGGGNVLIIILPLLIVLSTLLFLILVFLVFVLILKRKSRIRLGDDGGPVDLSVGDGVWGEGGVDGVEARWLEQQDDDVRRGYQRAKDWQLHHPPSSVPTDITLSQFLTIQEKGVSAWSFEPDYESNVAVYVQGRTEISFLDGPGMPQVEGGGNSVMANLPLPKLNEVYYFECKMYEKPESSDIAIGLATKPYPIFRLPGLNKYSVAYGSDGFRTHNYPFTTHSYGPPLKEGDVLGVGYRPRSGTVFFTRNGRKHEDCFVGLQRFNLFPCVGATGPATVHVNLGQAGFVFIEANVKKWGLAPSIGTLAPPPAYGSERGSILLESGFGGGGWRGQGEDAGDGPGSAGAGRSWMSAGSLASGSSSAQRPATPDQRRTSHRARRPKPPSASTTPVHPSPLRQLAPPAAGSSSTSSATTPQSESSIAGPGPSSVQRVTASTAARDDGSTGVTPYVSPVDREMSAFHPPSALDVLEDEGEDGELGGAVDTSSGQDEPSDGESDDFHNHHAAHDADALAHNPPTPNLLDISLHTLGAGGDGSFFGGRAQWAGSPTLEQQQQQGGLTPYSAVVDHRSSAQSSRTSSSDDSSSTARPLNPAQASPSPPTYSPLDPVRYADGVPTDLPASVISAALEAEDRAEAAARAARAAQGTDGEEDAGEGLLGGVWRWWRGGRAGESSPA